MLISQSERAVRGQYSDSNRGIGVTHIGKDRKCSEVLLKLGPVLGTQNVVNKLAAILPAPR